MTHTNADFLTDKKGNLRTTAASTKGGQHLPSSNYSHWNSNSETAAFTPTSHFGSSKRNDSRNTSEGSRGGDMRCFSSYLADNTKDPHMYEQLISQVAASFQSLSISEPQQDLSSSHNNDIAYSNRRGRESEASTRPSTGQGRRFSQQLSQGIDHLPSSGASGIQGKWRSQSSDLSSEFPCLIPQTGSSQDGRLHPQDLLSYSIDGADDSLCQSPPDGSNALEWQAQFFKTKLCPFYVADFATLESTKKYGSNIGWAKGSCLNGSSCRFAHSVSELRPLPDLRKTKLCSSYTKKTVCKTAGCPFAHSPQELRTSSSVFYKVTLCNFYKNQKCWNGPNCRFAHGDEELRVPPIEMNSDLSESSSTIPTTPVQTSEREISNLTTESIRNYHASLPGHLASHRGAGLLSPPKRGCAGRRIKDKTLERYQKDEDHLTIPLDGGRVQTRAGDLVPSDEIGFRRTQAHTQAHSQAHTQAHSQAHTQAHSQAHTQAHSQAHSQAPSRAHSQGPCQAPTQSYEPFENVESICEEVARGYNESSVAEKFLDDIVNRFDESTTRLLLTVLMEKEAQNEMPDGGHKMRESLSSLSSTTALSLGSVQSNDTAGSDFLPENDFENNLLRGNGEAENSATILNFLMNDLVESSSSFSATS